MRARIFAGRSARLSTQSTASKNLSARRMDRLDDETNGRMEQRRKNLVGQSARAN
ncbi:MAG: hypothetical protein WAN61_01265 [Minisyncoccia bacterium]